MTDKVKIEQKKYIREDKHRSSKVKIEDVLSGVGKGVCVKDDIAHQGEEKNIHADVDVIAHCIFFVMLSDF